MSRIDYVHPPWRYFPKSGEIKGYHWGILYPESVYDLKRRVLNAFGFLLKQEVSLDLKDFENNRMYRLYKKLKRENLIPEILSKKSKLSILELLETNLYYYDKFAFYLFFDKISEKLKYETRKWRLSLKRQELCIFGKYEYYFQNVNEQIFLLRLAGYKENSKGLIFHGINYFSFKVLIESFSNEELEKAIRIIIEIVKNGEKSKLKKLYELTKNKEWLNNVMKRGIPEYSFSFRIGKQRFLSNYLGLTRFLQSFSFPYLYLLLYSPFILKIFELTKSKNPILYQTIFKKLGKNISLSSISSCRKICNINFPEISNDKEIRRLIRKNSSLIKDQLIEKYAEKVSKPVYRKYMRNYLECLEKYEKNWKNKVDKITKELEKYISKIKDFDKELDKVIKNLKNIKERKNYIDKIKEVGWKEALKEKAEDTKGNIITISIKGLGRGPKLSREIRNFLEKNNIPFEAKCGKFIIYDKEQLLKTIKRIK